jgi:hypothetical protein
MNRAVPTDKQVTFCQSILFFGLQNTSPEKYQPLHKSWKQDLENLALVPSVQKGLLGSVFRRFSEIFPLEKSVKPSVIGIKGGFWEFSVISL